MKLGKVLKDMRKTYGFTQETIAARMNIDQATVSRIEKNQQPPSLEYLERFSTIVGKELILTFRDK